jgi:hypothetical protein
MPEKLVLCATGSSFRFVAGTLTRRFAPPSPAPRARGTLALAVGTRARRVGQQLCHPLEEIMRRA